MGPSRIVRLASSSSSPKSGAGAVRPTSAPVTGREGGAGSSCPRRPARPLFVAGRFAIPLPASGQLQGGCMKLLLIRHAIAEEREDFARTGKDDRLRPLTDEGRKKMKQGARGLRRCVPAFDLLAPSP